LMIAFQDACSSAAPSTANVTLSESSKVRFPGRSLS
jgi:hypothetical protein